MTLTEKQQLIYEFIRDFRQQRAISPTLDEMAQYFNVSKMTIHEHVKALEQKGVIRRTPHRARAIELVEDQRADEGFELPLCGLVAAGAPVEAIEEVERIDVVGLLRRRGDLYMLRVKGDSMIEDGILEGDYVIVERRADALSGQTVVARLDNGDATLKRLYKERDGFRLQPANRTMGPIFVRELQIDGVVVGILRTFDR
jgi:repressor LexA